MSVLTVTLNPALDLTVQADGWQRGIVNRGQMYHVAAGGKGVNVASILADWEVPVAATGFLGQSSEAFDELLSTKNIQDKFVRVLGKTRIGVKITDIQAQETTDINLPGPQISLFDLEELETRLQNVTQKVVVLAGSLPPGVDLDFYPRWVKHWREQGKWVVVDTSGAALKAVLDAEILPHVLKPNEHELQEAVGHDDLEAAARELRERGVELVVVSRGKKGALFFGESQIEAVSAPVQVVSSVGAGDAMVAGIITGHLERLSLKQTAQRATLFSVGKITQLGAHLPESLESFEAGIQVKEIQ